MEAKNMSIASDNKPDPKACVKPGWCQLTTSKGTAGHATIAMVLNLTGIANRVCTVG